MTVSINYVSAPPGTGKTSAAIAFMRRHIILGAKSQKKSKKHHRGYVFYVAPTINLFEQTMEGLRAVLPNKYHDRIISISSGKGTRNAGGQKVKDKINNVLLGRGVSSLDAVDFLPGSVLFITHHAFISLRKSPAFKKTTVLFDESRKWADMLDSVQMDAGVEELFHSLFKTKEVGASGISQITARRTVKAEILAQLRTKGAARSYKQLDQLYLSIVPEPSQPTRLKVYGMFEGTQSKRRLVRITLPSNPFTGFKAVYILSADFETSQMYHLLKMEGCSVRNATAEFLEKYAEGGLGKALNTIMHRCKHLILIPLLDTPQMPSKYLLDGGMILPKSKLTSFKEKKDELGISTSTLRDLSEYMNSAGAYPAKLRKSQRAMVKYMDEAGCHLNVLEWQMRCVQKIAQLWWKKHPPTTVNPIIVNKGYDKHKLNPDHFQYLDLGRVEGTNAYRDSNVVAFLAAVNPDKPLERLLQALLPKYDARQDFVVDKAIQSIGRGCIRNHLSEEPMIAVVPTLGLAELICARMSHLPIVDRNWMEKLGSYTPWSVQHLRSEEAQQRVSTKGLGKKAALKKRRSVALTDFRKRWPQYNSLSVQMYRLRKQLKTVESPELMARLEEVQEALDKVKAEMKEARAQEA